MIGSDQTVSSNNYVKSIDLKTKGCADLILHNPNRIAIGRPAICLLLYSFLTNRKQL